MEELERIITKFEGEIVGGKGNIYGEGPEDTKHFNMLYMPQSLTEENWLQSSTEFDFDADYNLSGMRLLRADNTIDLNSCVKPLANKLELTKFIYDPRYIFEHYKDKFKKSSESSFTVELDYNFGIAYPKTKIRLNFILAQNELSGIKVVSVNPDGKESPHSDITFDYSHPWLPPVILPLDDAGEPKEASEEDEQVDPALAWME